MYEYAVHRTPPLHTLYTAHNTSRLGRYFSALLSSSLLFSPRRTLDGRMNASRYGIDHRVTCNHTRCYSRPAGDCKRDAALEYRV